MLKLLNYVLMLVILCGGIQSLNGEALHCQFQDEHYVWGSMYTCKVSSLDISKNEMVIRSYTGTHLANRYDNDVKAIWIQRSNIKYIPEGLGSLFSLTAFLVQYSQLIEIKAENFLGMQNLEFLSLWDNKLTSVPSDAFSTLSKLKEIYLGSNSIKYIGIGVFDQLMNLNKVYLQYNVCVHNIYVGASGITQMKNDIVTNCKNPDVDPSTTKQNPKQEELDNLKNELFKAQKLQQENVVEINKLRNELQNAELENNKVTKENLKHLETTNSSTRQHSVLQPQLILILFIVFKFNSPTVNL